MELYIHYTSLPQDKELPDVVEELNEVLEEGGVVCGGEDGQRGAFDTNSTVEIGGMVIGIYE